MSTTSASTTASASASVSSTADASLSAGGSNLKIVGIILAVVSGLLIGSSFVFKKKGLLRSQAGQVAGEGVAYLKSVLWWTGMIMMILGEICNFAAYAFVEAIVVTPLGALSVVVCAILSSFFLNEKLSFFGWLGCGLCILGSVIIALNGPSEETVGQIREFQKLFLAPGFLAYTGVLIASSLAIIFYFAPRYGKKSMLWYIAVCSMIGGISVSVTTGLGAAIVTTAKGDSQFNYWFMYFLIAFVAVTLITEVYYLNVALALFNTAMVTPTYYVIFTFFSMVTTIVLFQGLKASVKEIITLVMGFLVICFGITILQMSKVDPTHLNKLDRRSTMLLQAARSQTETVEEKGAVGMEDPGIDALRGSFGTVGSIIRARSARRLSQSSHLSGSGSGFRSRSGQATLPGAPVDETGLPTWLSNVPSPNPEVSTMDRLNGHKRHQLYDNPMPSSSSVASATKGDEESQLSVDTSPSLRMAKKPTIKFDSTDVVHQYHRTGQGARNDPTAVHETRKALGAPGAVMASQGSPSGTNSIRARDYPPPPSSSPKIHIPSESQTNLLGSSPSDSPQQTAKIPAAFSQEHLIQSAPPTMKYGYGALPRQMPGRKDSRDVFQDSPSGGTLLSFPSVTDSARSGGATKTSWEDADERGSRRSSKSRERGRPQKRYPKGAGDDDREESVSLWQKNGSSDEDERAGIRLVRPADKGGDGRF